MSRSVLHRLTPLISARLRQNQRLLTVSSAVEQSPSESLDVVRMTENCVQRMKELHTKDASAEGRMLRLNVVAGGCSGFQYFFLLDDKKNEDDRIFEKEGVKLVVDDISYDFVKGATVDYVQELIRSAFVVTTNPNAEGGCSCKSSFRAKQ
ncbi:iron-sulfur assembly protein IscA-like 2, mitochondrial [Aristolochia californica]|uniref:iron-sulfur assembly protein IscA-like 2, mitochondrial n=1 Tax=Aristolochia californica TaxID=171875 RepID=UPI0035D5A896